MVLCQCMMFELFIINSLPFNFFFLKEKFNNQYISRSSGLVSLGIYHLFSELEMDAEKVS